MKGGNKMAVPGTIFFASIPKEYKNYVYPTDNYISKIEPEQGFFSSMVTHDGMRCGRITNSQFQEVYNTFYNTGVTFFYNRQYIDLSVYTCNKIMCSNSRWNSNWTTEGEGKRFFSSLFTITIDSANNTLNLKPVASNYSDFASGFLALDTHDEFFSGGSGYFYPIFEEGTPAETVPITNVDNTQGFINKTLFPSSVTVGTAYTVSIEKPSNYDIVTTPHIKIEADGITLLDIDMGVSGNVYSTSYTFTTAYTGATVTYTGVAREHITPTVSITNVDNTEGFINKTLFPSSVTVGTAYTVSIEKPSNYDIVTTPHIKIEADGNTLLDVDMVASGNVYSTSYTFTTAYTGATVTYTGVAREHITPPTDKTIILYKNISDNNVLNKTLLNPVTREIVFKDVTDVYNPELVLSINILDFNYCYIPVFHRYYFIENKQVIRKDLFKISCRCDVLASFKNDILASEATITKTSNYNPYYGEFKSEVRTQARILNFENNFNENGQLVLITVSGGEQVE